MLNIHLDTLHIKEGQQHKSIILIYIILSNKSIGTFTIIKKWIFIFLCFVFFLYIIFFKIYYKSFNRCGSRVLYTNGEEKNNNELIMNMNDPNLVLNWIKCAWVAFMAFILIIFVMHGRLVGLFAPLFMYKTPLFYSSI